MRVSAPKGSKDILYGQPPYGWKLTKNRSKLVKNSDEQRITVIVPTPIVFQMHPIAFCRWKAV